MNESKLIKNLKQFGYEIGETLFKNKNQSNNGDFNYRYWRFTEENFKLKESLFYLNTENDFIHFTSLDALFSILNSGFLRLYNLNNMDDVYEMEYAFRELAFEGNTKKSKEELYCFSMCSSNKIFSDKTKEKEHLLWKLHGRDGYGVILRLNIENNLKWNFYNLTEVYYGIEKFDFIKNFNSSNDNQILDDKICCFIKNPIYKFENEIRLVFDNRNPITIINNDNQKIFPITFPDKLQKETKIFYTHLPILNFYKNENDPIYISPKFTGKNYEIPKIKITEIILGYRYSNKDLEIIKNNIDNKYSDIYIRFSDLKAMY